MPSDPYVQWRQSVTQGIYRDGQWNPDQVGPWSAWHAGRVKDILAMPGGSVLIAVEHGGLWTSDPAGQTALCITDGIAEHRFNRVAVGPDGDDHVFAGGDTLWVTDPAAPVPLLNWQQIPSFPGGTVWDILVLGRTVVVAAQGIWWADIPPPVARRGCLGGLFGTPTPASAGYTWKQALIETPAGVVPTAAFYSLAEGQRDHGAPDGRRIRTIIAGGAGANDQQGIFLGSWDGKDLVLHGPSKVTDAAGNRTTFTATDRVAVASCASDLDRAYAGADDGTALAMLLRSDDAGRSWRTCGPGVDLDTVTGNLFDKCGHQAGHQVLSVYPNDPDVVSFGWFDAYVSFDGGATWNEPGGDDSFNYTNTHQHVDVHRVLLPPAASTEPPTPPTRLLVGCDGATTEITWGQGAGLIEGQFRSDGERGDLEAAVLEGNVLRHYRRPSDTLVWARAGDISQRATDRACMIQGDFGGDVKNFELVVPEGDDLVHYWRNNDGGGWNRAQTVCSGVTGPACMIQSDFGDDHGNFEVVTLEGSDLVHHWHDNGDAMNPWQRGVTITSHAAAGASMIRSDYGDDHRNFELVVLEDEGGVFGRALVHYWRDNDGDQSWVGPNLITRNATAPAWLIQADYPGDVDHHNFELFVNEGLELWHWIRDNSSDERPWVRRVRVSEAGERVDGPPVVIAGNYGQGDHGNFEMLSSAGGEVFHRWRDNEDPNLVWRRDARLSRYAFHYFTGWNQHTPTLMCNGYTDVDIGHGQLGLSQAIDGLIATGTQDNGVVLAVTDPGTPWVQPGGGDGNEAIWPAARSRSFDPLKAGSLLVWTNDDLNGAPRATLGDPWSFSAATPSVLALDGPDPAIAPPPDATAGLIRDPRLARVISPSYVEKPGVLAVIGTPAVVKGVSQAPLYGLFVDGPYESPRDQRQPPRGGWQFLANATVSAPTSDRDWPIRTMASFEGSTVIFAARVDAGVVPKVDRVELFSLDVEKRAITSMAVDPTVGFPGIAWIVPISSKHAYAATDDGRVLVWDGVQWRFPGRVLPGSPALRGLAVDPASTPPAVFVITTDTVYLSRDGTSTWSTAMAGLPASLECTNIHVLTDNQGVTRLHLSTYGRSTWVADRLQRG